MKYTIQHSALMQQPGLLFVFDSQPLSSVHVERPRPLTITVALRAVLLPIARLAVDLLLMNSQRGAV